MVVGISIWNFLDSKNFNLLWRWFAWSNQLLAAACLWVSTAYLLKQSENKYKSLFPGIPAFIMTSVVLTYIFGEPHIALGRFIPMWVAYIIGASLALSVFLVYLYMLLFKKNKNKENNIYQNVSH